MKDKIDIGKLINEARKAKGITQQELADKLKISDKAISDWETGKNLPDYEMIKRIEKILDVDILEQLENKKNKLKIKILWLVIASLVMVILFSFIFLINNYDKAKVYKIVLDDEYYSLEDSYLIITKDKLWLNMGEFKVIDYPLQPEFSLTLYYENEDSKEEIVKKNKYNYVTIGESKNNKLSLYNVLVNNKDNLYIEISYKDYMGETKENKIKLKLIEDNKDSINQVDNNLIKYLKANGYQEMDKQIYKKVYDKGIFFCDINDKKIYYQGNDDDKEYYAIGYDKYRHRVNYVVFVDGNVTEYDIKGESQNIKNENNYKLIHDMVITEGKKLGLFS